MTISTNLGRLQRTQLNPTDGLKIWEYVLRRLAVVGGWTDFLFENDTRTAEHEQYPHRLCSTIALHSSVNISETVRAIAKMHGTTFKD